MFAQNTDFEEHCSSVLSYIAFCNNTVLTTKTIKVFSNQKPRFKGMVRTLLKAWDAAYRSGDGLAYSKARSELNEGIKKAKGENQQRIEEHFKDSDSRNMWRGMKTITEYKSSTVPAPNHDAALPDTESVFSAV